MYKYFQPNKKDLKDNHGDFAIRALCKALDKTWVEIFDGLVPYAREQQCYLCQKPSYESFLNANNFVYTSIGRISKDMTVKKFASKHNRGTFIVYLKVGFQTHMVCVQDGDWYDTWDCGNRCVYGYYERKGE